MVLPQWWLRVKEVALAFAKYSISRGLADQRSRAVDDPGQRAGSLGKREARDTADRASAPKNPRQAGAGNLTRAFATYGEAALVLIGSDGIRRTTIFELRLPIVIAVELL